MINEKYDSPFNLKKSTPLRKIQNVNGSSLYIKRDDLNHPIIQGNKFRKLKYNFKFIFENNFSNLVTFGGAYSNHIVATAQAAKLSQLDVMGFIRGEELKTRPDKWSKSLHEAKKAGMKFTFLSRKEYQLKEQSEIVKQFLSKSTKPYLIPEGGSNSLALLGVAEIVDELAQQISPPTHIITACGTGGTCAGLIDGVAKQGWQTKVIGIPVLKGANFLHQEIVNLSQSHEQVDWQLYYDYHAGGYAKLEEKYITFGKRFRQETAIALDKVYTVKSFFAAFDLMKKGKIKAGSSVVILHTGGLQGGII